MRGTSLVAAGRNGAIAVIAIAESGSLYDPKDTFYMDKIAVGPEAAGCIDIRLSPRRNVHAIAKALGKPVGEVTCVVLDRPRHEAGCHSRVGSPRHRMSFNSTHEGVQRGG